MHLRYIVFFAVLLAGILTLDAWNADAARFGGGKSFGGGSFMSKPAAPPSPAPGLNRAAPGAAGTPGAAVHSRFGGMGGMLGGLLAGSLIGSLLFGGAFHGGGFMDILLIGLLIYFAFKLFSRLRRPAEANGPSQYQSYQPEDRKSVV